MWRTPPACVPQSPPSLKPPAPRAFTLTELLVAVAIILLLMTILAGAVSAARTSAKINATRATIDKLNTILMAQLGTYDSVSVPIPTPLPAGFSTAAEYRSWYIRRNLISGDMPDRWEDLRTMATGTTVAAGSATFPITNIQRANVAVFRSGSATVTDSFAGAECLFMIVMRSGMADCLDCGALRTSDIGDQDTNASGTVVGDGMPEFLDAWGRPIGFILWPVGVELPPGSGVAFFSGSRTPQSAFPGTAGPSPSATLGIRPLIFSAGPDGVYSINVGVTAIPSSILTGTNCGNPADSTVKQLGSLFLEPGDGRADNITNFDAEARQ